MKQPYELTNQVIDYLLPLGTNLSVNTELTESDWKSTHTEIFHINDGEFLYLCSDSFRLIVDSETYSLLAVEFRHRVDTISLVNNRLVVSRVGFDEQGIKLSLNRIRNILGRRFQH